MGRPQELASGWHIISLIDRIHAVTKDRSKHNVAFLIHDAIGTAWSVANLFNVFAERAEKDIEDRVRKALHK